MIIKSDVCALSETKLKGKGPVIFREVDDTALVADSEEKLCRLVSEFGKVCERRKLRVTVGKSKVIRCSRYGNGDC